MSYHIYIILFKRYTFCVRMYSNRTCHSVTMSHLTFVTLWTVAHPAPLSSTISQSLLKFMSIELVMLSNHLIFYRPLLLLPSLFPSSSILAWEIPGTEEPRRLQSSGSQESGTTKPPPSCPRSQHQGVFQCLCSS